MITLKTTYDKLQASFSTLQDSFNSLKAENEQLKTDKTALEAKITELTNSQSTVDKAALDQANKDLEAANKMLTDMTVQFDSFKAQSKTAAAQALDIVAAQGVPAGTINVPAGEAKPNVLVEASKLQGNALTEYLKANMHLIGEALKKK